MENSNVLLEKNVPCTMRDGTILYADIYRPAAEGKFPILLTRLPYNKDLPHFSHRYLDTNRLVANGYVVIIQDVRGRFQSEGEFFPFEHEGEDGYDTVEWAADLPFSTGKVGMFGLSYYGFTQLLAAAHHPPHLAAIFPAMTLNDQRNNMLFHNGALQLGLLETWTLESIVPDLLRRKYREDEESYHDALKKMAKTYNKIQDWYRFTPIREWPPVQELGVAGFFQELLDRNLEDERWKNTSIAHLNGELSIPAYHLGGWYDCMLSETIKNYTGMMQHPHSAVANAQKLMIGAWGHGDYSSVLGERTFGIHSSGDWIDLKENLTDLHLRWFNYWLKGIDTKIQEEAPVRIFVMGINQWRDEQEWPLARTKYIPYYFHSAGDANTKDGSGTLSIEKPLKEPTDQFIYDPKNPVPTHGGAVLHAAVATEGPRDQRQIEKRADVLVYTSDPLKEQVEVTGHVKVALWAKTDAKDTDFTAKLVDVLPDGTAYNLTDGIVRAKYRNGYKPEAELSGEIVQYEIDLWATSNVFLPGHRIRVEISSSNFPRFDVNPNTGESLINSSEMIQATQIIYHDEQHPSHILLPIIPAD